MPRRPLRHHHAPGGIMPGPNPFLSSLLLTLLLPLLIQCAGLSQPDRINLKDCLTYSTDEAVAKELLEPSEDKASNHRATWKSVEQFPSGQFHHGPLWLFAEATCFLQRQPSDVMLLTIENGFLQYADLMHLKAGRVRAIHCSRKLHRT
jgi:hypothetical protein